MKTILFLCTGNSCRSQMAHGFCQNLYGDRYKVYSAGIKKHGLNPRAVKVMKDLGVDISKHKSELVEELPIQNFDYVFTVCGHAHETCPVFHGGRVIHVGFDDPPALTKDMSNEEEILEVYKRVALEIKDFIEKMESHF